ncbi:mitochondrial large subunit ribosomal protein-domain-containing protein [Crepidotus variabilis]|uniref:Large ribosomal subunit protein mL49 n=1 Tax=Crepidotus variabilis TaxID=179855 RepID=A0A9P6ENC8_9AGAR|nr:mitochondrial large subunit ribosomal protein-domain-containing protein [Crepidotus variabilis]
MLSSLRRQILPQVQRQQRAFTQVLSPSASLASSSSTQNSTETSSGLSPKPYFVPRNSTGNLPVYSDLRNAGSRYLVLVRNVEGSISTLAKELNQNLFPEGSYEAEKMKVQISQGKHIIISGGDSGWKAEVTKWLQKKGF